jgi:hypothetical protein
MRWLILVKVLCCDPAAVALTVRQQTHQRASLLR